MQRRTVLLFVTTMVFALAGCAGKLDYVKPSSPPISDNSVTVDRTKEEVWKTIVPALGKQFFVINNMDKDSGIINISYTGDPEKYVDCGRISSYVKNARGERTYDFPASKAYQEYEIMNENGLFFQKRTMSLEGRMNIVVEELGPKQTRVTVNTKYILTKTALTSDVQSRSANDTETISFNTGQQSAFRAGTTCQCNGRFEKDVLSLLLGSQ